MVYRGKPSTGCKKCRERKIKCDERSSGCVKCEQKGLICPGYDNSLDRLFQDETAHVQHKAKKAKAKALIRREERETCRVLKTVARNRANDPLESIIQPLMLNSLIDQGMTFFMSRYSVGIEEPPLSSAAFHHHLSTNGIHPIVATSMTALGLAGIANLCNDAAVMREGMRWYAKALHMTNQALMSPEDLKSDNTLLATIILSLWETTMNEKDLNGWVSHVDGSAQLLKMRGRQQFSTPAGRRMFMQVIGLLTMNCLGRGIEMPDFVNEWQDEIEKFEDKSNPGQRSYHVHCATVNFRGRVLKGEIVGLETIVDRALEVDNFARKMFDGAGPDWLYEEVVTTDDMPGVWNKTYHIYPSIAAAQAWNWYRYNRIYIHDIIRNCLVAGLSMNPPILTSDKYVGLLQESTRILLEMQAGILATIPQYLQDTPKSRFHSRSPSSASSPSSTSSQSNASVSTDQSRTRGKKAIHENFAVVAPFSNYGSTAIPKDRLPVMRVSGGYSSIWALYIAGATPIASRESQTYVITSLFRLRDEFGLNLCHVLGGALRMKIFLTDTMQDPFRLVPDYLPNPPDHANESAFDLEKWNNPAVPRFEHTTVLR